MTAKFSIHPHEDAQADLKELLRTHYFDARRIIAAIEQCENDRDLFRTMLSDEPTEDEEGINFQRWQRLRRKGVEVWRFKVLDLERDGKRYRIFYTSTDSRTVWILAVQPRNLVDYDDPIHPLANRIERAVDSLRPTAERAKQVRGRRVPDYVLTVTRTK